MELIKIIDMGEKIIAKYNIYEDKIGDLKLIEMFEYVTARIEEAEHQDERRGDAIAEAVKYKQEIGEEIFERLKDYRVLQREHKELYKDWIKLAKEKNEMRKEKKIKEEVKLKIKDINKIQSEIEEELEEENNYIIYINKITGEIEWKQFEIRESVKDRLPEDSMMLYGTCWTEDMMDEARYEAYLDLEDNATDLWDILNGFRNESDIRDKVDKKISERIYEDRMEELDEYITYLKNKIMSRDGYQADIKIRGI